MSIEKVISTFIPQQFPAFYKEDGPNYVAFVKAYYEWMEQTGQTINASRSLMDYADIDLTETAFIQYFKNTYIHNLSESIIADKRLLVKHILELYRTKGTQRAYELLFQLLFNESIEIYIPGNFLFKPSDGTWEIPHYIETTDCQYLVNMIGRGIRNASGDAAAVVETVTQKLINNRIVNVIYISSIDGIFKYGDLILCDGVVDSSGNKLITLTNAPRVVGSLTAIAVESGGSDYNVGDILNVTGSGLEGKARVSAITNENGKVNFTLTNGGSGFSVNAVVTVATTTDLLLTGSTDTFTVNTSIYDTTTNANGTVTFANSTFVQLINFSAGLSFAAGHTVTNGTSTATISSVFGGGGTGASFKIGGLVNQEVVYINTDYISGYTGTTLQTQIQINTNTHAVAFTAGDTVQSTANVKLLECSYISANNPVVGEKFANVTLGVANLYVYNSDNTQIWVTGSEADLNNANVVIGAVFTSNTTASVIALTSTPTKLTLTGNAIIFSTDTSAVVANVSSGSPVFVPTKTLIDANNNLANAAITSVVSLTDWHFPSRTTLATNLDTKINAALAYKTLTAGTIAFLSNINPGTGYSSAPYVDIIEPDIAALKIDDGLGTGNYKGHDAVVDVLVSSAQGVVTAAQVMNSGFGFIPGETVTLSGANSSVVVTGSSIVDSDGVGDGKWKTNDGFLSDIIKIQDSYYYQNYSYEIVAQRMLSTYETLVKELVHPTGVALFGKYQFKRQQLGSQSVPIQFSVTQS
jgi:hypothetical protein